MAAVMVLSWCLVAAGWWDRVGGTTIIGLVKAQVDSTTIKVGGSTFIRLVGTLVWGRFVTVGVGSEVLL